MNQLQHSSARLSLPWAALNGRRADSSPVSPATHLIVHDQTYTHGTSRGMARLWTRGYAPGRVKSVRGWGDGLLKTVPCLGANLGTGFFLRECHANGLANQFLVAERVRNRLTQRHQCHLKFPFRATSYGSIRTEGSIGNVQEIVGEIRNV